ncbi:hypothetical protein [Haliscomenobacter hydrossis]|uniref:Uncharacterized protein n=1 Tax=Haliscomenobacter hydrossis (strain ATCC 27775 / DSM 1100 / LMG 10767 / O) TaxID=760192 RepID=F4L8D2_HALH1|nr:hypothetical protein [Haliscomenobacter hydrossis]AEE54640.1 hypothetical protein Halhy_6830 [Haliscomenobacter hydrossis DSM 1100]
MAKSVIDKSKLTLGIAKPIVKKTPDSQTSSGSIEEAVNQIHNNGTPPNPDPQPVAAPEPKTKLPTAKSAQPKASPKTKVQEPAPQFSASAFQGSDSPKKQGRPTSKVDDMDYIRVSIDLPKPLYKSIKKKLVDLEMTMMDYVTMLIEKEEQG